MYKLRSVIKHKKGGLDVSVNSIVILIFAVIILGLGIRFIKSMFGKASASFTEVSDTAKREVESTLAQSSKRVVLSNKDFKVEPGQSINAYLGIKNYLKSAETFSILSDSNAGFNSDGSPADPSKSSIACYYFIPGDGQSDQSDAEELITFNTLPSIKLAPGEDQVLKLIIRADNSAPLGTYYCKVYVANPDSHSQNKEYASFPFNVEVVKSS